MLERPVHEWTKDELLQKERGQPLGQIYGDQIRAEIIRRAALRNGTVPLGRRYSGCGFGTWIDDRGSCDFDRALPA